MNRMLAFGCSLTFGHGLKDCIGFDNAPGTFCSNYAWPSLLAKKLNREVLNLSHPGASNKEIWHKIVNTQFENDNLVFILWSHHDRYCIIEDENYTHQLGVWNVSKDKRSKLYFKNFYNDLDANYDTNLRMMHSEYFLREKNVKVFHLNVNRQFIIQSWNTLNFLKPNFNIIRQQFPKALDNHHPGEEAHEEFANQIYKEIKYENK